MSGNLYIHEQHCYLWFCLFDDGDGDAMMHATVLSALNFLFPSLSLIFLTEINEQLSLRDPFCCQQQRYNNFRKKIRFAKYLRFSRPVANEKIRLGKKA